MKSETKKLLIVDRVHPHLIDLLEKSGFSCNIRHDLNYEKYLLLEDDYVGLIIRSRFLIDNQAIDSKKNLKFIVRIGSGMENIDVAYAERKGISCFSTPAGNAPSVAEHCLGMLLSALRNITTSNNEVRIGKWEREKNKGHEIGSRTVGIIGYGHTGKAFADMLKPFGCKIYVFDKYRTGFKEEHIVETTLQELLRECDVISLHINYFEDNYHFFNDELIKQSIHPFIFINTSRGLAVKTDDIIKNLQNGKIKYACIDVLEYETVQLKIPSKSSWPEPLQRLAQMENVILTPHIAGQTFDAEKRHADIAFEKIIGLTDNQFKT